MNKRTILVAGGVFLFALSAASVFTSAANALLTTSHQDDSGSDSNAEERGIVSKENHRWVPNRYSLV